MTEQELDLYKAKCADLDALEQRMFALVQKWRSDDDALELMDPEEYQNARGRNECANELEASIVPGAPAMP